MAVVVFAVALAKATWVSEQHPLSIVVVAEAGVKDLVLEVLALEIARIVSHWLEVVPEIAAELQLPIRPGDSQETEEFIGRRYNSYRAGGLLQG